MAESEASKLVVLIVVGTRPEAIKLVPIILALRESDHYEPIVVSTGQHQRMVDYIFELAGIKPDVVLWAGSRRSSLNERVASVMQRFEDFCAERFEVDPDGTADAAEDILERPRPGRGPRPRRHQLGDGRRALGLPPADPGDARRGRACAPAASTSPRSRRSSTAR